jgi:hypothetical protein
MTGALANGNGVREGQAVVVLSELVSQVIFGRYGYQTANAVPMGERLLDRAFVCFPNSVPHVDGIDIHDMLAHLTQWCLAFKRHVRTSIKTLAGVEAGGFGVTCDYAVKEWVGDTGVDGVFVTIDMDLDVKGECDMRKDSKALTLALNARAMALRISS